ncbi:CoA-transferase family III domain-containing protein [Lentinula aciculospora]|uniref:CoA-transferase family III domain-containing protein n=1 Tax=Lentinula aciculospora TaxID=153920 RepID=A0A9W9A7B2_9AGAR|nr:CoA-transferase family III domain-containing protein [Lentinula aciculospora]
MALKGKKVIEFAGLAPAPFAGLVLSDNGASVVRVDRPSASTLDVLCRGKRSVAINSKIPSGRELLKRLIASSDVLIDPFRPGVMERLGLGPDVFLGSSGLNQRLVYARIIGFPRTGPYKNMAGHDLNYLALSGILSMLPGSTDKPSFPLNLLADFAGGGMHSVTKILLALLERNENNQGQVIDVDMVSGTRYVSTSPLIHRLNPFTGRFAAERGANLLDGGAPFYNIYACRDGGLLTLACIEPHFFKIFIGRFLEVLPEYLVLSDEWREFPFIAAQADRKLWLKLKQLLTSGFSLRTRNEWADIFFGTDACCVPVLTPEEAALKLSSCTALVSDKEAGSCLLNPGRHTREVLTVELGLTENEYEKLVDEGAIGQC